MSNAPHFAHRVQSREERVLRALSKLAEIVGRSTVEPDNDEAFCIRDQFDEMILEIRRDEVNRG